MDAAMKESSKAQRGMNTGKSGMEAFRKGAVMPAKSPALHDKLLAKQQTLEEELAKLLDAEALAEDGLADQIVLAQADTPAAGDAAGSATGSAAEAGAAGAAEGGATAAAGAEAGTAAMAGAAAGVSGGMLAAIGLGLAAAAAGGGGGGGGSGIAGIIAVVTEGGIVLDGLISGATVFRDLNGNNIRDPNEPQTTTGVDGSFQLSGTGGVFIAYGGVDQTTGATMPANLMMKGLAVSGAVLTPLTTLVVELALLSAATPGLPTLAELQAAEATIEATSLAIAPSGGILAYNPIAAADLDTDGYIAQAQAILTVINGLVAASGGALTPAEIIGGMVEIVANGGDLNLTDPADVLALITAIDADNTIDNDNSVSDAIANLACNVSAAVNAEGYEDPTAIAAFNEANGSNTLGVIAVTAGQMVNLTGTVLVYTAAGALALGEAGVAAAIGAGATLTLKDSAGNLNTNVGDLDTLLTAVSIADVLITVTGTPSLAQLAAIDGLTTTPLAYAAVGDSAADLAANADGYITGSVNVTVTTTASIAQLDAIDGHTSGTITISADIADDIGNLIAGDVVSAWVTAGINVIVNDEATPVQLAALDSANGSGTVIASSLSGAAADLLASPYVGAGTNLSVTGAASIAQLTALDTANGGGSLAYTAITDTAANLFPSAVSAYVIADTEITVTTAATLQQLADLDDANGSGDLWYTAVADTAANLAANPGGYIADAVNVTVTGTATLAQLATIDGHTSGTLTYTAIADTAANLAANTGGYITGAVNVTVEDAVLVSEIAAILDLPTTGTITFEAGVVDSAANIVAGLATIAAAGITAVDATDNSVALSHTQAGVALDNGIEFAADDVLTITGTTSQLLALNLANLVNLGGSSVTFDSSDDAVTLNATQAGYFLDAGVAFHTSDVITLTGTGTDLAALDLASLSDLGGAAGIVLDASDNAVTLNEAQASGIYDAGATFAANDAITITLNDGEITNAITNYTTGNLGGASITFNANDDTVSISLAQVDALDGRKFHSSDAITITGSDGVTLAALTLADYNTAVIGGASVILDASDNLVLLTTGQAAAALAAGVAFGGNDEAVVTGTSAELLALDLANIGDLCSGTISFDSTDDAITLTTTQAGHLLAVGVDFSSSDAITITGPGTSLAGIDLTSLASLGGGSLILDADDDAVTLTASQAAGILNAGASFDNGDAITITGTGAQLAALDLGSIASLGGTDIRFNASDNAVTLTDGAAFDLRTQSGFVNNNAVFDSSDHITVTGIIDAEVAQAIAELTADVNGLGGASVTLTGDGDVELSLADADLLRTNTNQTWAASDAITITGSNGTTLAALTFADYSTAVLGGSSVYLDAADDAVTLTHTQAAAALAAGVKFGLNDALTVTGTSAQLLALDLANLSDLGGNAPLVFDSSDNAITLNATQAEQLMYASVAFDAGDAVTITGTGAALSALDLANLSSDLGGSGITLQVTSGQMQVPLSLLDGSITFDIQGGSVVVVADSETNLTGGSGLAINLTTIDDAGISTIIVTEGALVLAVANLGGFAFAEDGGTVTVSDTAAALSGNFAAIAAAGISRVDLSGGTLELTLSDVLAMGGLAFTNSGGSLAFNDTAVALTGGDGLASNFAAILDAGLGDYITITGSNADLLNLDLAIIGERGEATAALTYDSDVVEVGLNATQAAALIAANVVFDSGDNLIITLADGEIADAISNFTAANLNPGGFPIVFDGDGTVSLTVGQADALAGREFAADDAITITGAGTVLAGLTFGNYETAAIGGSSVTLDASDNAVTLTHTQATAAIAAGISFAAEDVITLTGTGAELAALFADAGLGGLGGSLITLNASDNAVTLTAAQAAFLKEAGDAHTGTIKFHSGDAITITGIASEDEASAFSNYRPTNIGGSTVTLGATDGVWDVSAGSLDGAGQVGLRFLGTINIVTANGDGTLDAMTNIDTRLFTEAVVTFDGGQDITIPVGRTLYMLADQVSLTSVGGPGYFSITEATTLDLTGFAYNGTTPGSLRIHGNDGGDDTIVGPDFGTTFFGQGGNDTITGGSGSDVIDGGDGNDIIVGGTGNDTIKGGNGADDLTGGAGSDQFYFYYDTGTGANYAAATPGDIASILTNGVDVIRDFTDGEDVIDLPPAGVTESNSGDAIGDHTIAQGNILVLKGDGANGVGSGDAVVLANLSGGDATSFADYEMAIYIVNGASVTWSTDDFI